MNTKQMGLAVGALIGAILGAGTAYLLITAPPANEDGEEHKPLSGRDLIGLTGSAALLIRKLDDIRRKI